MLLIVEKIVKKEGFRVGEIYESHWTDRFGFKSVNKGKFLRWFKRELDGLFYCEFEWEEPMKGWRSIVREDELLECDFREIKPKT